MQKEKKNLNFNSDSIFFHFISKLHRWMEAGQPGVPGVSALKPAGMGRSQGQGRVQTRPLLMEEGTVLGALRGRRSVLKGNVQVGLLQAIQSCPFTRGKCYTNC